MHGDRRCSLKKVSISTGFRYKVLAMCRMKCTVGSGEKDIVSDIIIP